MPEGPNSASPGFAPVSSTSSDDLVSEMFFCFMVILNISRLCLLLTFPITI